MQISRLQAQLGPLHGQDPEGTNPGRLWSDRFYVYIIYYILIFQFANYMFMGILMLGSYHREPRAAGVFVPGMAQSTLKDIHLPRTTSFETMMRQDTLELGACGSQESLGRTPTPKRLDMSDPTANGSEPPVETPPAHPSPTVAPAIEPKAPPAVPKPPSQPNRVLEALPGPGLNQPASSAGPEEPPAELDGTMYTDGTYWKFSTYTSDSKFQIFFCYMVCIS